MEDNWVEDPDGRSDGGTDTLVEDWHHHTITFHDYRKANVNIMYMYVSSNSEY